MCLLSSVVFILYGIHFAKETSRFSDNERSIKTKLTNKRMARVSFVFAGMFLTIAYLLGG